jgi:hypothetical protein
MHATLLSASGYFDTWGAGLLFACYGGLNGEKNVDAQCLRRGSHGR